MLQCLIISLATIFTVLNLRKLGRRVFAKKHPYKEEYNVEWLNSHTLYIKGLLKSDVKGEVVETILNDFLENYGGKVISYQVRYEILNL